MTAKDHWILYTHMVITQMCKWNITKKREKKRGKEFKIKCHNFPKFDKKFPYPRCKTNINDNKQNEAQAWQHHSHNVESQR